MTTFAPRTHEIPFVDPSTLASLPFNDDILRDFRCLPPFKDGKVLADAVVVSMDTDRRTPNSWERVFDLYSRQRKQPDFDGNAFCQEHFALPEGAIPLDDTDLLQDRPPIEDHIHGMWAKLRKENPNDTEGGLLALPHPYYAPGERFSESYGWDSYFTALGLAAEGNWEAVYGAVDNHASLINRFGHVPNGNRKYFLSRSHPPVFSHMVELLASHHGNEVITHYGPAMQREHAFWMNGAKDLATDTTQSHAYRRVVRLPNGSLLNRYYDDLNTPRPESYLEDVETAEGSTRLEIYRDIRAAAESGYDFSMKRWCTEDNLRSMRTTDLLPIDLNSWLVHLEQTIADACLLRGEMEQSVSYAAAAQRRIEAINFHCWNARTGTYSDYDFTAQQQTGIETIAMATPLFTGIASKKQSMGVASALAKRFLKYGGLATTLEDTGQQWDGNLGWAPTNYKAIVGMLAASQKYESGGRGVMQDLSDESRYRWVQGNRMVYWQTGQMHEKYNVYRPSDLATGGEYEPQTGFGWTNGVFLALTQGVDARLSAVRHERRQQLVPAR